jgi:acyl-CoA thioester hydrolase
MKHEFEQKVYYADTDAYGVVWHGSYLRWMEAGRCQWCDAAGLDLIDLDQNHDIVLPVVNLNVRYKQSAKLGDTIIIETNLAKFNGLSATFRQRISAGAPAPLVSKTALLRTADNPRQVMTSKGRVILEAEVEIVAIAASTGKLYRRMPDILAKAFEKELA